jgi:hypothetical protein
MPVRRNTNLRKFSERLLSFSVDVLLESEVVAGRNAIRESVRGCSRGVSDGSMSHLGKTLSWGIPPHPPTVTGPETYLIVGSLMCDR